ncbi:MAG: primosomal protein N' [Granulosicoccus sp.]
MGALVQVAIPTPLFRVFDYQWKSNQAIVRGARVSVPFGRRQVIGVVLGALQHSEVPANKLRAVQRIHDVEPLIPKDLMDLLDWASRYYHHPLGEVLASALPGLLRKGQVAAIAEREFFRWTGPLPIPESLKRAKVQRQIASYLADLSGKSAAADSMVRISPRWRASIAPLLDKGWVVCEKALKIPDNKAHAQAPELNDEQRCAVDQVVGALGSAQRFLLNGVTGSGKTEVYLRCIEAACRKGGQALVLVPEISLTPQLMSRFEQRLDGCLVSLHSGLNDAERMQNWLCAAHGHADVVIGTRSSILAAMPRLGLIIVDEEHDNSFKQQDGFRYHARDLALMRARAWKCPVVLGSATPSFESLNNVDTGKFIELPLTIRAGGAEPPRLGLMDIRRRKLIEGMSDRMIDAIREHLDKAGQALVFINRRGFAPTLLCNDCGAAADCKRCDANMTVHARTNRLRCHHCGSERRMPQGCESCGSVELDRVGYGTERIAAALEEAFPDVLIARIDRDSTRRKGALEQQLELATSGEARILVGTQMLAKGHHFPKLTLVGILDADRGLFGTDFRSLEHMGQLILQVAGRAGREKNSGTVLIQTRNPDSPMLQTLISEGYAPFSQIAMTERKLADLPPYSFMAMVRAEAATASEPHQFLLEVAASLQRFSGTTLDVMGPAPAPMERLGGRFRAQLLLQSDLRSTLNDSLSRLSTEIDGLPGARRCRWSIDVDPVDLF